MIWIIASIPLSVLDFSSGPTSVFLISESRNKKNNILSDNNRRVSEGENDLDRIKML